MDLTNPLPFRYQREPHLPKPLLIPSKSGIGTAEANGVEYVMEIQPRSISHPSASPRPRSPLPPQKLANIANALGVNTPMPAVYRSPSPSGSSSFRTPSRYLLHVVPPSFLPSDDDDDGSDPEGKSTVSASAYRTQFRRGTLIPLYPSLHSQLGAIAREYNLPSTGGLVLYLMHSSYGVATDGPRISDDIWKLLWHKALQAERNDSQTRTGASLDFRSGRSTPASPFPNSKREDLDPSARTPSSPFPYPSPSTSSTPSSEIHLPLSGQSGQHQTSTPDVPPELTPNPFLPILAKVEFDIDRRKAPWYDAWAHGKRKRTRWRAGRDDGGGRIQLALPKRAGSRDPLRPDFSSHSEDGGEYALLDDGEGEKTAVDDDEQDQETVVIHQQQDPLSDVFGNDAATWHELQTARKPKSKPGLGLGISASQPELIIPPGDEKDETKEEPRDTDEVVKLWDEKKRPTLPLHPPDQRRRGAPAPLTLVPTTHSPVSVLSPRLPTGQPSSLPYLSPLAPDTNSLNSGVKDDKKSRRRTGMIFGDLEVKIVAEPEEMYDAELDGARSSQVVMKQKLDQLEKQLAALSPRKLNAFHSPGARNDDWPPRSAPPNVNQFNITRPHHKSRNSINASPQRQDTSNAVKPTAGASMEPFKAPPRQDSLAASHIHSPRRKAHSRGQGSQSSSGSSKNMPELNAGSAARPPVSYSSLTKALPPMPTSPTAARRSPPHLTLQRASDTRKLGDVSEETAARTLEAGAVQEVLLPVAPLVVNPRSPVLPLSPDPFSKNPIEEVRQPRVSEDKDSSRSVPISSRPPSRSHGTKLPAAVPEDSEIDTQSSRFSMDSEQGVEKLQGPERLATQRRSRTSSIMSVRSLRNLWRKSGTSGKTSIGGGSPLPPLPLSPTQNQHFRRESMASQRSIRPAEQQQQRPSGAAPRPDSGADPFQFDNVSIYKSTSTASLVGNATSTTANYGPSGGSMGRAKGILKGWNGNANPSDADVRVMGRPSLATLRRSMSTASMSQSDLGDREGSGGTRSSPPPSTPPDTRPEPTRHKQRPSGSPEPVMMLSNSLPTSSTIGELSRYPENLSSTNLLSSVDDSATPRLTDFASPPRRPPGLAS